MDAEGARWVVLAALMGLLAPWTQAWAQGAPLFQDTFESGTLLTTDAPPGQWQDNVEPVAGNSITPSAAAAHRGAYGVRQVDAHTGTGTSDEGHLDSPPLAATGSVGLRFWFRYGNTNGLGEAFLGQLPMTPQAAPGTGQAATVEFTANDGTVALGGYDAAGRYQYAAGDAGFQPNRWRLVEVEVTGIGGPQGTRSAFVDGVLMATTAGLDFTGEQVAGGVLGEYYTGDTVFTGNLDFDDFRVAALPQASNLVLQGPASAATGSCTPLTLRVQSSSGALAPSPYTFDAALGAALGARFFADARCTQGLSALTVAAGASQVALYVQPRVPGAEALQAQYVDFLSRASLLQVTPGPGFDGGAGSGGGFDGGVGGGGGGAVGPPRVLSVGCSCKQASGAGPGDALVLGLLALSLSRRRRAAGRASARAP